MPADIGRISGIMLKDNLDRLGVPLAFETDLIYLDVINNQVGIKTTSTSDEFTISGTVRTTTLISDSTLGNGNLEISSGEISTILGNLNFTAQDRVEVPEIKTVNIDLSSKVISSYTTDTNIEFRPHGTGSLRVFNDFNVTGNLNATGNITLDGNITLGSDASDSVFIDAEVNSSIVPDLDNTYTLGSASRRWQGLYSNLINGQQITTGGLSTSEGIDLALRQGKIWYVASNGLDTNEGDHPNGPFATIKHALAQATDGDTVQIYPGIYEEIFPLTVPVGVTVNGTGIRSVTVRPTDATKNNNAFLLNGETCVSNLSVKDFYTGYAFSFAPGFTVTSRSPYVQNITVITRGSSITTADPLGFLSGDAGRGALVDGNLATISSKEASMLFHAVTFITPGVDALVMTSGVRVEWLNSFSYFANRGMYATQGLGRTTPTGTVYGAEIRSIGSANVYGNYGAVVDGANTLMYLIQHNFAYIGTAGDSSNDKTLVIQANETVELNGGKLYYQSQDHEGTWRVGDAFFINLDDGTVSFDTSGIDFDSLSSLTISTGADTTFIDGARITVGNFQLTGNTLSSLTGDVNILSASASTNLDLNVNVGKNLDVTGDFSLGGQLIIGNQSTDTVDFNAPLDQNLVPDVTNNYSLGAPTLVWKDAWLSLANIDSVQLTTNTITTSATDTSLEIKANNIGEIQIPTNNVTVTNDLSVGLLSDLNTTNITGNILQTGNRGITGDVDVSEFLDISNNLTVTKTVTLPEIFIDNNVISVTTVDADLILEAAGTGKIIAPLDNVYIDNDLSVTLVSTTNGITVDNVTTSNEFYTSDILIDNNSISTTDTNSTLELTADGTGSVFVETQEIVSNTIKNTDTINITPGAGKQTIIDSTGSLRIPNGNNTQRPIKALGDLRFNTTDATYEGWDGSTSRGLGGVFSADRLSSVKATKTTNILNFTTGSVLSMDIDATRLRTNGLYVDSLELNNSLILGNNTDLTISPSGTGSTVIEQISIKDNNFQNNNTSTPLTFASVGEGYVRFVGTNGFIIPYGDDLARPASPEIGDLRYNIQQGYMEIYDGTQYNSAAGVGESVTENFMEEEITLWGIVLG
jgi:hypothetical protein